MSTNFPALVCEEDVMTATVYLLGGLPQTSSRLSASAGPVSRGWQASAQPGHE